ncbi:MAG: FAD-dependent thymidylate synthase [Epsilonproteobacteria bacterium]|nr:thymidylate synthase (FAD) [Campylobacterota bacterium]NPA56982.1 FAD-dependent thymidylate synthase [Campylobacterota bacterium]
MDVELLHYTPLTVVAHAIRTCWQSFDKGDRGGPRDRELIDRVGNKYKHSSTLEHLVYTFYIRGISRALLQELARHRIASLSVKSTRYTLKELKKEPPFQDGDLKRAEEFIVLTGDERVDRASVEALERLRQLLVAGISNDFAKYALPECYKSELTWTINGRSLQNFLSLRSSPSALWEMRNLAYAVFDALPEDHKYLFHPYLTPKEEK